MTGDLTLVLADGEGHDLLHHLLVDYLIKAAIVLVALLVLAAGMVLIWKKVSRAEPLAMTDRNLRSDSAQVGDD